MAASTCLHPYQNIHIVASKRDAPFLDVPHRRGLSSNTRSLYIHDLFVVRHPSSYTSNQRHVYVRQFFRRLQRRVYCSDNPNNLVEAQRDDLTVLNKADEVLSVKVGGVVLDCGRGIVPPSHP